MAKSMLGAAVVALAGAAALTLSNVRTEEPKQAGTPAVKATEVTVLNSYSSWRLFNVLKPPVILEGQTVKPLLLNKSWLDRETAPPPPDWLKPDFDDHKWNRGSIYAASYAPWLARLCVRGKFTVTDLNKVKNLKLTVSFHGGAVVYINGQEIAWANLSKETGLAEPYPPDAFVSVEGALLTAEKERDRPDDPKKAMRKRTLADVSIPAGLLHPGVNVLECEIIRAPYDKVVNEKKDPKSNFWNFAWNTCCLVQIELVAGSNDGIIANTTRSAEFQVWDNNLLSNDYDLDFGERNEKLYPVGITGTKNGSFSGKVVVGSSKPISNLKVVPGDLKGQGGVIPASLMRIRCGYPWGSDYLVIPNVALPFSSVYPAEASLLGCISDTVPEEIPVYAKKSINKIRAGATPPVFGAVVPVFITVKVPKDAAPGTYLGSVNISAAGAQPVTVPVELKVADWCLPDSQDFRTWVEIIQSPDTLAMEYNVPLWSDRHWELIGESLKLISASGSRVLYVPLIAETNYGHGETMVRWVKKGENKYEYDFSVMEKYLDIAEKNMGKPKLVIFYVWDVYMIQEGHEASATVSQEQNEILKTMRENKVLLGRGPVVTLLNMNKSERLELPKYSDPSSKALWQGLADELKTRMKKRGLENAMTLGMMNDAWPTKNEVAFWAELLPGVPWAVHAHFGGGPNAYDSAKIDYQTRVWGIEEGAEKSLLGWKSEAPNLLARYNRAREFDSDPNSAWRSYAELAITGNQRGVGRIGGDFWDVLKNNKGERKGRIYARYPQSNWRNLDIYCAMLAPGPKGPGITQHYLHLLEGIQECEARIALERVLSDESLKSGLDKELSERCAKALFERLQDVHISFDSMINRYGQAPTFSNGVAAHNWFIGSGWEARSETLFSLAGEVERKLGKK